MNDIRRTFLWVIFGFSMVLLWDQWQVYNGNKATFFPAPTAAPADKATAAATPSAVKDLPVASAPIAATNTPAGPSQVPVSANAPVATPLERIDVSTDVLKLSFDTEGGSLVRSEFLKFGDVADEQKPFVLLDQSKSRVYLAQTGLIGGPFASHKTPMKFTGERELKAGQNELTLTFE
ncbi:MAG: membrane protein insertase YidC, partial [Burkholderiales bacterium]